MGLVSLAMLSIELMVLNRAGQVHKRAICTSFQGHTGVNETEHMISNRWSLPGIVKLFSTASPSYWHPDGGTHVACL